MKRIRGLKAILFCGVTLIVLAATFGAWLLVLETGGYRSSHGFRLDGKAYRALQAAQAKKPGTHLVIKTRGALVGPDMYLESYLSEEFDPRDCEALTTRGQTIEIERYLYEQRVLRPVISHQGNDCTTGYTLSSF